MARTSLWESDFQSDTVKLLAKDGWTVWKLEPGTGTIPKHAPDTMMLIPGGRVLFCEFKAAGGKVEEGQRRLLYLLTKAGFSCCFCDPRPAHCIPKTMTAKEILAYDAPRHTDTDAPHG